MNDHIEVKYLGSTYLYNMLQDFRHILIFDFRKAYEDCHIRDSFSIQNHQKLLYAILESNKQAIQRQTKYTFKKIRRYFFVNQEKINLDSNSIKQVINLIKNNQLSTKEDKYYVLTQPFSIFYEKFSFMCIQQKKIMSIQDLNQRQKAIYYPYAKFPAQIVSNRLYLGNIYNSNSQMQLKSLGITCLVDFIDYTAQQKVPQFKTQNNSYNYFHLPYNKNVPCTIDFDWVFGQIQKAIQQSPTKKMLFYCKDGESVSAAFAIGYLMYKCGLEVTMASLKVCQSISRVQADKSIYTQLLVTNL